MKPDTNPQTQLSDTRDRITALLQKQSAQPSPVQNVGDISQALLSALSSNTGAAGFQQAYQGQQQSKLAKNKAELEPNMQLYSLMQQEVQNGNQDALAADKAIKDITGSDVKGYNDIANIMHQSPDKINVANATMSAAKAANQLGYKAKMSKDEADVELKRAEANYYNNAKGKGAGGGVLDNLATKLMSDNPGMTYTQAIYLAQTGYRQGMTLDNKGNIAPMTGVPESKATIAGQTAEAKQAGKVKGGNRAQAEIDLPNVEQQGQYTIKLVDDLLNHPGMNQVVGAKNLYSGAAPMAIGLNPIAGTDAADFKARLDQLKGKQFLEAYNTLKGSGQISNIEGEKGTNAIARMQVAQSEKAFTDAANEFKDIVSKGIGRTKVRAGQNPETSSSSSITPEEARAELKRRGKL